ncbi:hypothetical protein [Croceibacterium mercuriale]|nr:hypothetical protein [Croceibacterium mercuriale]
MRWVIAAVVLLALTAGGDPIDPVLGDSDLRPQWRKLDDGSRFAVVSSPGGDNLVAIRCWLDGGGYRCLKAGRSASLESVTVTSAWERSLPQMVSPVVHAFNGYSCGIEGDLYERVSRDGYVLATNQLEAEEARWAGDDVKTIMTENELTGWSYFDCLDVLLSVRAESLEALSTAVVSKDMAG